MAERSSPRWPSLVGTSLCIAGTGVAAYLTYEHYTGSTSLVCSNKGLVNCLAVTTSSYAYAAGIPVAVLGLVFFVTMFALQLPAMWRRTEPAIRAGRVVWALAGLGSVIYLLYAELFLIDAICLWCTAVHVLTFAVFVSTVFATLETAPLDEAGTGRSGPSPRRS